MRCKKKDTLRFQIVIAFYLFLYFYFPNAVEKVDLWSNVSGLYYLTFSSHICFLNC